MRLSHQEQSAIKGVLSKFDPSGKVYLFGSRVDDHRRGGDIDLLFETEREMSLKEELQFHAESHFESRSSDVASKLAGVLPTDG
jgi:predicted nucleotidyltransferase